MAYLQVPSTPECTIRRIALPWLVLLAACDLTGPEPPDRAVLDLVQLSSSFASSCGVAADGRAYCWGNNESGELGGGPNTPLLPSFRPMRVDAAFAFRQVEAGVAHTCGLSTDGVAYCWGRNVEGQLGLGPEDGPERCAPADCSSLPRAVSTTVRFEDVDVGFAHSCAVSTTGSAWCWGDGGSGALGTGLPQDDARSPVAVAVDGVEFARLSAMQRTTCALTSDGSVYCWGQNALGQAGVAADDAEECPVGDAVTSCVPAPTRLTTDETFVALSVGGAHGCALTGDGRAYCWGSNGSGQLGLSVEATNTLCPDTPGAFCTAPVAVAGGHRFTALSAGGSHTCGTTDSGATLCWGSHLTGQIGDCSSAARRDEPSAVCGGLPFTGVAAGGSHTCAHTSAGQGYCWGDNDVGALGSASFTAFGPVVIAPWVDLTNGAG